MTTDPQPSVLSEEDKARLAAILTTPPEQLAPVAQTGTQRVLIQPREVFDIEGRQVTENVVLQGEVPDGFARYVAIFTTPIIVAEKDPAGGPSRKTQRDIPLRAVLPAASLTEAFDMFDAVAKSTAEQYIEQLRSEHLRAQLALQQ